MLCTEPIPLDSETVETVSAIHRPITVSETAVRTAVSETMVHITTEDSDKGMADIEHSHSQEDSVIQILNQDLIITLSQTTITEVSDPMTTEVSDQAEALQVEALEAVLQAAV